MRIEGNYTIKTSRARVYAQLLNPEAISRAMPGCESLTPVGDNVYEMVLKMGIAAVKGTYKGRIELSGFTPPERYSMRVEGSGTPGVVNGGGDLRLEENGGNETQIFYSGDVEVSGKVAAVGSRLIGSVAKMVINKYFAEMAKQMEGQQ